MAELTVTTAADVVEAGDGVLSLREAVQQANATGAGDTIRFADALDGRTLVLTQGQLTLTQDIAIDGANSGVTVDADRQSRVLAVAGAGTDVGITGLGINDGYAREEDGGGVLVGRGGRLTLEGCTVSGSGAGYAFTSYANGAGVFAAAGSRVTVADSLFVGNNANGLGGAIATGANVTLRVEDSRFTDNRGGTGGAIAVTDGSSLTLSRSLVSDNVAVTYRGGSGGGIHAAQSRVLVSSSTISGNVGAYEGGGISSVASAIDLVNATVADNTASSRLLVGQGGAVFGDGTLTLAWSTVTGNYATSSLEVRGYFGTGGIDFSGDLRVANSLVTGNYAQSYQDAPRATDVDGIVTVSNGHNIFGSAVTGDVAGDLEGVPARDVLVPGGPTFSGGPTPTVQLLDLGGNPALSGGEPAVAGSLDQRGFPRGAPDGTNPDIGAFELTQTSISRSPSTGNDVLTGTAAADALSARAGADLVAGAGGDDGLRGEDGGDTLLGGLGDDVLDGGTGLDTASYHDAGGAVAASLAGQASSGALGADRLLRVENLEGGRFADRLEGDALANALGGGEGADRLRGLKGEDVLLGGSGDDLLNGGRGADGLAGGGGRDLFDYDALADSAPGATGRDQILDFTHLHDRFDLASLDARAATAANEALAFLAAEGAAFTDAGQVRWSRDDGQILVEANVDADRGADLQIEVVGPRSLVAADFVL